MERTQTIFRSAADIGVEESNSSGLGMSFKRPAKRKRALNFRKYSSNALNTCRLRHLMCLCCSIVMLVFANTYGCDYSFLGGLRNSVDPLRPRQWCSCDKTIIFNTFYKGSKIAYVALSCTIWIKALVQSFLGNEFGYSFKKSSLLDRIAGLLLTGSTSKWVLSFGSAP